MLEERRAEAERRIQEIDAEIEPQIREHHELAECVALIDQAQSKGRRRSRAGGSTGTRAPRGSNKPKILEALRSKSEGMTAGEIAEATGISANAVYRYLRDLTEEGAVRKDGTQYTVA